MAYLTDKELKILQAIPTNELDGTFNKPFFEKLPDWAPIAYYMGYKLKWDRVFHRTESYHPYVDENGNSKWKTNVTEKYECHPKFKQGHGSYEFNDWRISCLHEIVEVMNKNGHFDEDVQKAWLTLDNKIITKAIFKKIKSLKK